MYEGVGVGGLERDTERVSNLLFYAQSISQPGGERAREREGMYVCVGIQDLTCLCLIFVLQATHLYPCSCPPSVTSTSGTLPPTCTSCGPSPASRSTSSAGSSGWLFTSVQVSLPQHSWCRGASEDAEVFDTMLRSAS